MRSYKRIINILILVLVINLLLIGCRGTNSDKIIANKSEKTVSINSSQTKIIDEKLDAGEISNNVYVNKYLGLSFKGFTDWYIQDGIIKELLQGKEIKTFVNLFLHL